MKSVYLRILWLWRDLVLQPPRPDANGEDTSTRTVQIIVGSHVLASDSDLRLQRPIVLSIYTWRGYDSREQKLPI